VSIDAAGARWRLSGYRRRIWSPVTWTTQADRIVLPAGRHRPNAAGQEACAEPGGVVSASPLIGSFRLTTCPPAWWTLTTEVTS
jgi:hypothetical protein